MSTGNINFDFDSYINEMRYLKVRRNTKTVFTIEEIKDANTPTDNNASEIADKVVTESDVHNNINIGLADASNACVMIHAN